MKNPVKLSHFIFLATAVLYLHHFLFISDPTIIAREVKALNKLQGIDPDEVIPIYQTR
jgi:hypothetical protein